MSVNSRTKGKVAELEASKFLTSRGFPARRGRQYSGDPSAPDIICPSIPYHLEIKRRERVNLRDWIVKAEADSGGKPWIIMHRWNNGPWLATLKADDLMELLRESLL